MANPVPTRKSDVSTVFEERVRGLRDDSLVGVVEMVNGPQADAEGTTNASWPGLLWLRPTAPAPVQLEGEAPAPVDFWNGDLFDLAKLGQAYSREQVNNWFIAAHQDGRNPGVTGDGVVTQTQAAYLGCAERAFRARHTQRRPRAFLHAMGRRAAHGHADGVFTQQLEYVRALVQASSLKGRKSNPSAAPGT